jgi:hypothetical protein
MSVSSFITLPVNPEDLPPNLVGSGRLFSVAVGLLCPDCRERVGRFDVLTCDDDEAFQLACPLCGFTIVACESRR